VRWTGGALGSTVDRGRHGHSAWQRLAGARRAGARARRSSSAGRNRERGTRELDGLLTRARAAMWWLSDDDEE
jgi:hypothetical protein